MKKLMLLGCLPLFMAACTGSGDKKAADSTADSATANKTIAANASRVASRAIALPELITLNGVPLDKADNYVSDFINSSSVYKSPTSVWYSKKFVDTLTSILEKEGADGFRLYFAKFPNGHNIIMVSTREIGGIHQDYFEHAEPFLKTVEANGTVDYTGKSGGMLYDPAMQCPTSDNCNVSYNHYLKCSEAADRVKNFSNDKFETTSEWFDIDLLRYLKKELSIGNKADGIRIYYARHPVNKTHGVIIVTTKKSATNTNIHDDYYTCSSRIRDVDNGEQCPLSCNGVTWPKPE